jgi:3-hydroxyisobutyrate dehydrogenase-like beta-hydroxyacid dehydrogenase
MSATAVSTKFDRIGFIGLGVMGSAQCSNLVAKSGIPVSVFDVVADAVARLTDQGAESYPSIADLAAAVDIVFLSLPGGPQVEEVLLGEGGVFDSARAGTTIVDLSTSPVELAKRLGEEAKVRGLRFADAPVARTRQAAIDGTLSITVGGDDAVVEEIEPLLRTMATDVVHCGPNGAGALMKIVNNTIVFETVVAIAEALTLIRRTGLVDPDVAFQALANGSAASFTLENHGRKALLPDTHPEGIFPAAYMLKDVGYALDAAADVDTMLPAATLAHELLQRTVDAGYALSYHTAVVRIIEGADRP